MEIFIFIFFSKGAPVFVEGGGRLRHGTMAQWPVQVWREHAIKLNAVWWPIQNVYGQYFNNLKFC